MRRVLVICGGLGLVIYLMAVYVVRI